MENPPTVRQRRLGAILRELREKAGMSIAEAAQVIECTTSKISRVETGHRGIKPLELRLLLDAYGVDDPARRDMLLKLSRNARKRDWWDIEYGELVAEQRYREYLTFESEAALLRSYENELVPGLLQTPDYARAVIAAGRFDASDEEIDALVEVRMARQEVLRRKDRLVKLWTVLNEAVLRRPMGSVETMRAQLRYLLDVTNRLRSVVTVQVLPFSVGAHPGIDGPFTLIGFPEQTAPDVVWLENYRGSLYLENAADVERYTLAFTHLTARALAPSESRDLIAKVVKELDDPGSEPSRMA